MNFDEELLVKRLGYDIEATLRQMGVTSMLPKSERERIARLVLEEVGEVVA